MKISSKNIFEIRREGKNIILQYNTKSDAVQAIFKLWDETVKQI